MIFKIEIILIANNQPIDMFKEKPPITFGQIASFNFELKYTKALLSLVKKISVILL